MSEHHPFHLTIFTGETGRRLFHPLLEQGVFIQGRTGCTLRAFLRDKLAVDDHYLDQRVQTLFLNGRPVDDLDTRHIKEGDRLALSAAMPGLVGATLRKGGHLAAMRKAISECRPDECEGEKGGIIELRVYNLLLKELATHLFSSGVQVKGARLAALLTSQKERIGAEVEKFLIDERTVALEELLSFPWGDADVYLRFSAVGEA